MHKPTNTRFRAIAAIAAVAGAFCALPAAASAADRAPAPDRAHQVPAQSSQASGDQARKPTKVAGKLGFNALLWQRTIADPWGVYRVYYYNQCNPRRGVRYLKIQTNWIYRTYQCWAILA